MKWIRLLATAVLGIAVIVLAGMLLNRASGGVVEAQDDWPPKHKKLSDTANDSTSADIEVIRLANGTRVVVVVWMEGTSDHELAGGIKMRWQFEGSTSTWRTGSSQVFPAPSSRYVYGFPALALHQAEAGNLEAHVVWLRTDLLTSQTGVVYQKCLLTESNAVCTNYASLSYANSAAPAIALDATGIPHVVWEQAGQIYYTNKSGGSWGTAWPMQTDYSNISTPSYKGFGKSPTIVVVGQQGGGGEVVAAASNGVYVAWDREVTASGEDPRAKWFGIWFAKRSDLSAVQSGNTEGAKWQIDLVSESVGADTARQDDWPSLSAGTGNGIYLAWQRFVYEKIGTPTCNQHKIAYRVFTGTNVFQDWWPGGASDLVYESPPLTVTTWIPSGVSGDQDLYSGARPAIQVVSPGNDTDQLHIVWQQSDTSCIPGGPEGGSLAPLEIEASGESDVDGLPLQVYYAYAAHGYGLSSAPAWSAPQLITVAGTAAGFVANPDLSMIENDKEDIPVHTSYPHVVLLDRFKTTDYYAWNVWYANDRPVDWAEADDPKVYLPIVLKNYE